MFKVVETFSGLGAQAKALERIGIEHEIVHTCDWDVGATIAYCLIHRGGIPVKEYRGVSDEGIDRFLDSQTFSLDGKNPSNLRGMSSETKQILYAAVKETNNLVSITDVNGCNIPESVDLLTYSFPCQDLSKCGYWHGNITGISREAHNRSGMLWEIERILKEMHDENRGLPHFLVMENVTNILSDTHREDFNDWKATLEKLGYFNQIYRLNAKNFGVPQKRERAYMISVLIGQDLLKHMKLCQYFEENNLENPDTAERYRSRCFSLKDVLKLDYSVDVYRQEADASQPNDTPSREKIFQDNDMLFDGKTVNEICVNTITTRQDRNPNSGLVTYLNAIPGKTRWRYLTPRECFLLMGFDEEDYSRIIGCNPEYNSGKPLFTNDKLIRYAGNSICVDVLEAIFRQIIEIDDFLY